MSANRLAAGADEIVSANRRMLEQMMHTNQMLAESTKQAAEAVKTAAEQLNDHRERKSASSSQHAAENATAAGQQRQGAGGQASLTTEAVRQHTQSFRTASPAEQLPRQQRQYANSHASGGAGGNGGSGQRLPDPRGPWGRIGAWRLLQRTEAGSQRLELDVYDGLAVGDVLEIDFGTPEAEFITVTKFGSIIPAAPTRFAHNPGAEVRRIVEGTGQRWAPLPSEVNATPGSQRASTLIDADGIEDRASWSPRKREHQL